MKKFNKILTICLCILFIATSVFTGIYLFSEPSEDVNNNNEVISDSVDKEKNDYNGMIYFANESENTGASEASYTMKGGAIHISSGSTFEFDSGTIQNHEGYFGGAVYVSKDATFKMTGGTICYNYSKYGGAIYVEEGGNCIIEGGSIINNMAENAPAIYVENNAFIKINGETVNVDSNEYVEYRDTEVNYYVDGIKAKTVLQSVPVVNMSEAPLSYENCNGYFVDRDMTIPLERGELITNYIDSATNSETSIPTYNVYTYKATLDKLNFTAFGNSSYYVSSVNKTITGTVVIPREYNGKEVNGISSSGFVSCKSIEKVVLPGTITSISSSAFNGNSSLTSINMTNNIDTIEQYAFYNSTALPEITIPGKVTKIGNNAFMGCTALTKVNTTDVNAWARIYFESDLANPIYYSKNLYENHALVENLVLTDVENVSSLAFLTCQTIKTLELNGTIKTIGASAFNRCTALTSVNIPSSLTSIGNYGFYSCSALKKVNITDLNKWAEITFSNLDANPAYCARSLYLNGELLESGVIDSASKISSYAFYYNTALKNIVIDDKTWTLTIGENSFTYSGLEILDINVGLIPAVFGGLTKLKEVIFGSYVRMVENSAFTGCTNINKVATDDLYNWTWISFGNESSNPMYYSKNLYYNDALVTDIVIDDISTIGSYTFVNINLNSVTITRNNGGFGYKPFSNCNFKYLNIDMDNIPVSVFPYNTLLTEVTFGKHVKTVQADAFVGCTNISKVITEDVNAWVQIDFGNYASNPLITAGNLYQDDVLLTDITIDEATAIKPNVFFGYTKLQKLRIYNSVESIDETAFTNCAFTDLILGMTNIPAVFKNKTSLKNVTFTPEVVSVESDAFSGCTSIEKTMTSNVDKWAEIQFANTLANPIYYSKGLYNLLGVLITDLQLNGALSIGPFAFINYEKLETLDLGIAQTIGESAFNKCTNLKEVIMPTTLINVEKNAFVYCQSLEKVITPDVNEYAGITFADYPANPLYHCGNLYENENLVTNLFLTVETIV